MDAIAYLYAEVFCYYALGIAALMTGFAALLAGIGLVRRS